MMTAFPKPLHAAFFGDSGVGKTTLCYYICYESDLNMSKTTIGVDHHTLDIESRQAKYHLEVWDTAGQELFQGMTKAYMRDRDLAFVLFSLHDPETFTSAARWVNNVRAGSPNAVIILIGNKSDLPQKVLTSEAEVFAKAQGLLFINVSAIKHENISLLMSMIAETCDKIALTKNKAQQNNGGVSLKRADNQTSTKPCCGN